MKPIPLEPALCLQPQTQPPKVDRYFTFACVDGSEGITECYRLRYQVFCLERGFLSSDDYPDHMESDGYDAHSLHFLASHLHGEPAGTARLVTNGPLGLPMAHHCALDPAYRFLGDANHPLGSHFAEISRLAVSRGFRRRQGDTVYGGPPRRSPGPEGDPSSPPSAPPRDVPEMVSGLFRLIYQESKRRGITHWVVAMERSLQVMLKRMGIAFSAIGPEVDYYGPVRPYVAEIAAVERYVCRERVDTRDYMVAGLETHLRPKLDSETQATDAGQDARGVASTVVAA